MDIDDDRMCPAKEPPCRRRGYIFQAAVLGLVLSAVPGCGSSSGEVPVSGSVFLSDGTPLTEGRLVLIPDPFDADQMPPGATLADDGSFTCRSFTGENGILPGQYRVILQFPTGKGAINPLTRTFAKYTKFETTTLAIDVPETGLQDVVLELDM